MNRKSLTRREFCGLAAGSLVGAGLAVGPKSTTWAKAMSPKPTVAMARNAGVWAGEGLAINPAEIRRLLDRTMCMAFDKKNVVDAWKAVVSPKDIVGIKINCLGGKRIATHRELTDAVIQSLMEAGVPAGNIIIWERSDKDLTKGGYALQKAPGQVRCMGPDGMFSEPLIAGEVETKLNTIISETCTALINLPVMKTHDLAGVTCALKNNVGGIPNPAKFHPENCVAVGDLNALPAIKDKTRLAIVDALRPLYDQGPADYPLARYNDNCLIAGTDLVAVDRTVMTRLREKRDAVKGGDWPLKDPPAYIFRASELGLGQSESDRINVVEEELKAVL